MEQCLEPVSLLQCRIRLSFQRFNKRRFSWKGGHETVKINIQRGLFFNHFVKYFNYFQLSFNLKPYETTLLLLVKWKALDVFALNRHVSTTYEHVIIGVACLLKEKLHFSPAEIYEMFITDHRNTWFHWSEIKQQHAKGLDRCLHRLSNNGGTAQSFLTYQQPLTVHVRSLSHLSEEGEREMTNNEDSNYLPYNLSSTLFSCSHLSHHIFLNRYKERICSAVCLLWLWQNATC